METQVESLAASPPMTPAGYMAKKIASRQHWLKADHVRDIYSVSKCASPDFCHFINYWKHNGYILFDSPSLIAGVAADASADLSQCTLFYYEIYNREFEPDLDRWNPVSEEPCYQTRVEPPSKRHLEGFDVTAGTLAADHSPLSCNGLAETIPVNEHCLLTSLDEAVRLIDTGAFTNSEPGPLRIYAVYSCPWPESVSRCIT